MVQKIVSNVCVTLLVAALAVGAALGVGVESAAIKPADKLDFDQEKAAAHMRELEERMFRISEMIRQTEQEHSARLILALQKSREDMILEQMKEIRGLIAAGKLDEASAQQAQVVRKLEELRQLLLATDLDLMLKLDRLRKLTDAIARADKLTKEQLRQAAESDKLDKQDKPDDKDLDQLKKDQQKNREGAAALKSDVERIVPKGSPAPGQLGQAGKAMSGAEGSLAGKKPGEAKPQQSSAAESLQKARQALADEREKLLEELQAQVRAQVTDALNQMLEKQRKIRESTEALAPQMKPGNNAAILAVRRLAEGETAMIELAEKTIALVEQTEYSVAMPFALRSIQRQMKTVAAALDAGRADAQVIAGEKDVEKQILDLLETMKEQAQAESKAGDPSQGGCKSCNQSAKLIAELKMVRVLQLSVNQQTRDADGRRPVAGDQPLDGEVKKAIQSVRDREAEVRDSMKRLHRKHCEKCQDTVS